MDLNLVVLGGRLAAEPELRTFSGGACLLRCLITVRTTEGRRRVDVLPITLWDPGPELFRAPLRPGDELCAVASVQRRFWASPTGRASALELVAHHVERRSGGSDGGPG